MRIAIIGGGPGGLYFAALAMQLDPTHEITVWERNAPDDTFGFGVVFSDETLGGIEHADVVIYRQMEREFARWDDIDVHYKDTVITSGGHGFAAMSRRRLLEILQARCLELGVTIHFRTEALPADELARTHDLVVAADGVNSLVRAKYADTYQPQIDVRQCKYMWLGTDLVFDAFTFDIRETPYGVMQVHAYPYDATGSTFIVEMHDSVWRAAGFDRMAARDFAPETATRSPSPASATSSRTCWRPPGARQQQPLDQLRDRTQRHLAAPQRRAARRRRPHRALLDRVGHQARHGGRARARRVPARAARRRHRTRRVRGRAQAGRPQHAAGRAGEPRVVREPRPVRAPGARAVRVQHHDPQPPGDVRQPAPARPGVRRSHRRVVRRGGATTRDRAGPAAPYARRCSSRSGCAASS
jgi:2-polyprenyl-6-methoxyphenol hydroxylase-like FAD-dependent oxidoreductase